MNCQEIINEIPLYCYGEVSSETEEAVESHVAQCAACRTELERQRSFLDMMDRREDLGEAALLAGCRAELRARIAPQARRAGWLESLTRWQLLFRVPVGAMALIGLGFLGGRFYADRPEGQFSTVRSIEAAAGQVNIAVDEVRRHVVSGAPHDPRIEKLLISAMQEESNPGVRVESIGILKSNADSEVVRQALVDSLTRDPNSAVRLKALEGLKPYAADATVRRTLANVLLKDENAQVRMQAIDLLTAHRDDSIVGVLQDAVRREDNSYVRDRSVRLLEEMKASVGTY
jgi:hypothetical protein